MTFKNKLLVAAISASPLLAVENPATNLAVNHQIRPFLKELNAEGSKPFWEDGYKAASAVLDKLQAKTKVDLSGIDVEEKTITLDGQTIKLHIVRPSGEKKILPAFMFFHGGVWLLGNFENHKRMVRDLVVGSGAAAIFVDYTPLPEGRYPVAINEAYAATKWVAKHGAEIGVDGSRIAVVGNSVGANMAIAVVLMAKEQGGPKIRYQVLFWPATDANVDTPSYKEFSEGYFLPAALMEYGWNKYAPDAKQRQEIYVSPLRATTEQLSGLPPTLIQTAENDVLRDEGEAYARKLDAAGVPVIAVRYNGMIHDFGLLNAMSQLPATRDALRQASEELRKNLK